MKGLLLSIGFFACIGARAARYDQYYTDGSGHRIEAQDAIVASVKGADVYKCVSVEAKASKSGTSIGVRGVKKPKASK